MLSRSASWRRRTPSSHRQDPLRGGPPCGAAFRRDGPLASYRPVHVIRPAQPDDVEVVRNFLNEYAASLQLDLSFQDFDSELADPLAFYELVLLAENGCVALRRLDEDTCEMKRLYVRSTARGGGLGRRLA